MHLFKPFALQAVALISLSPLSKATGVGILVEVSYWSHFRDIDGICDHLDNDALLLLTEIPDLWHY